MGSVNAQIKRGSAELAVLALLAEHSLHRYEIAKQIEVQTGGVLRFDMASLYPMLHRLERKSWSKRNGKPCPTAAAVAATGSRLLAESESPNFVLSGVPFSRR